MTLAIISITVSLTSHHFVTVEIYVSATLLQACSEMIMPMCADGVQDFFEPVKWDTTTEVKACAKRYGITPQPNWVMTNYLGVNITGATNIIFR